MVVRDDALFRPIIVLDGNSDDEIEVLDLSISSDNAAKKKKPEHQL